MAATDRKYKQFEDGIVEKVDSIKDFAECCQVDNKCKKHFEDVGECVTTCLPACIREAPLEYLDCINEEVEKNGGETDKCGREACVTAFVDEDEGIEDELDFNGDAFDLEELQDLLVGVSESDLEECSLIEPFIEDVCDLGGDCCEECETELGDVIDCLLNDVVIPFTALLLNTTIDECPMQDDGCEVDFRRGLSENTVEKFGAFMNEQRTISHKGRALIAESNKRVLEGHIIDVEHCETYMTNNMVLGNTTNGMNQFMECVIGAATDALAVAGAEAEANAGSGASVLGMAGLVATLLATIF